MMAYGSGCIFNPFTRMHIHGVDVGQSVRESLRKTVELSYLTDRLLQDIKQTEAYTVGLIDERGNLLRTPDTIYEQALISPLSRLLFKLKNYIPVDAQTLTESIKLFNNSPESVEEFESKLNFEHEATHLIKQLKNLINQNINKMSLEKIEEAIESAILSSIV